MNGFDTLTRRLLALFLLAASAAAPTAVAQVCAVGGTSALPPPTVVHLRGYHASFQSPTRLAVDSLGRIYVADPAGGTVLVRAADGRVVARAEGLGSPTSVAAAADGSRIYVGDGIDGRVTAYAPDWQPLFDLGQGDGELAFPGDLALDPATGDVWVADSSAHRLKVYDSTGAWRLSIGQRGNASGQFQYPAGIFIDAAADEVLVADQLNARIQIFDRQGNWKSCIGENGSGSGRFIMPQGIWADGLGRIFVSDAFEGWVHVVDRQGATVSWIGDVNDVGVGPGQLTTPSDVVIDPSGRLVVTSGTTARLEMFGLDGFVDPEGVVQAEVEVRPASFVPLLDSTVTATIEIPGYSLGLVDLASLSANGVAAVSGSAAIGDSDGDDVPDVSLDFAGDLLAATLPAEGDGALHVTGQLTGFELEGFATIHVVVAPDSDGDGVPDSVDVCAGFDDALDADGDGVPDGCDVCAGSDDALDTDGDGVPDGCDICAGSNDALELDGDGVPYGCDRCVGFDDAFDADGDGVPDACDVCAGFNDALDADGDRVPDGCDVCPGFNDALCIFLDGFESGDASAWSQRVPPS